MSKFRFHFRKVTLTAFMMLVCLVFCVSAQTTLTTDEVTDDYAIVNGIRYERVRTIQQLESIPGIEIVNKRKILNPNQNPNWDNIGLRLTVIGRKRKFVCPCKNGDSKCVCMVVDYENSELKVWGSDTDSETNDTNLNLIDNSLINNQGYKKIYYNSIYDAIVIK